MRAYLKRAGLWPSQPQCFFWLEVGFSLLISPQPGIEPTPSPWKMKSQPVDHQGGIHLTYFESQGHWGLVSCLKSKPPSGSLFACDLHSAGDVKLGSWVRRKPKDQLKQRMSLDWAVWFLIPPASSGSRGGWRLAVNAEHRAGRRPYLFSTVLLQAIEEMTGIGKPKGQHLKVF